MWLKRGIVRRVSVKVVLEVFGRDSAYSCNGNDVSMLGCGVVASILWIASRVCVNVGATGFSLRNMRIGHLRCRWWDDHLFRMADGIDFVKRNDGLDGWCADFRPSRRGTVRVGLLLWCSQCCSTFWSISVLILEWPLESIPFVVAFVSFVWSDGVKLQSLAKYLGL